MKTEFKNIDRFYVINFADLAVSIQTNPITFHTITAFYPDTLVQEQAITGCSDHYRAILNEYFIHIVAAANSKTICI